MNNFSFRNELKPVELSCSFDYIQFSNASIKQIHLPVGCDEWVKIDIIQEHGVNYLTTWQNQIDK